MGEEGRCLGDKMKGDDGREMEDNTEKDKEGSGGGKGREITDKLRGRRGEVLG